MYHRSPFGPLSRWNSGAHTLRPRLAGKSLNTATGAAAFNAAIVGALRIVSGPFHGVVIR
jgi:hypothetical protein